MQDQSDQLIRFRARQSGPYTQTRNVVDLVIPSSNDVYDLTASYVLLYVKPTLNSPRQVPNSVYQYSVAYKSSLNAISDTAFISHFRLSTARQGTIDETRHVNRLRATMNELTQSREQKLSNSYRSVYQITERSGQRGGPFSQLLGEGDVSTEPSLEREVPIYIPLDQLTNLGKVSRWPMQKTGETTLRLELENPNNLTVDWIPHISNPVAMDDLTAVDPGPTVIVTQDTEPRWLEDSPFHLNQALSVAYTHSTSGAGTLLTYISALEWIRGTPENGQFKITLANALPAIAGGEQITAIVLSEAPPSTGTTTDITLSINRADVLVRKIIRPGGKLPTSLQFLKYDVEDFTGSGQSPFQRQFYLPAGPAGQTLNAILLFYNPGELISNSSDAFSYRVALNGEFEQDSDILFNSAQQLQELRRAFVNAGLPLSDLSLQAPRFHETTGTDRYQRNPDQTIKLLAQPIMVGDTKGDQHAMQLSLNYSGGGGASRLLLYKQIVASVKLGK